MAQANLIKLSNDQMMSLFLIVWSWKTASTCQIYYILVPILIILQFIDNYCVYTLLDPRSKSYGVFYVGTSKADENDVKADKAQNTKVDGSAKGQRIKSIIDDGSSIIFTVIRRFDNEDQAEEFVDEIICASTGLVNAIDD